MSEIVAEGIIDADALTQWVETFTPLVEEGAVHFDDAGLTTRVVTPGQVVLIGPVEFDQRAFESYHAEGQAVVGLPFGEVEHRLDAADADDLVDVAVDMETRHLRLRYRNVEHTVALIDPDALRNEPDIPDVDVPNTVTIEGAVLDEAIDQADLVSDHITIECDPDAREMVFVGQGDTDTATVSASDDDLLDPTTIEAETESIYPQEFMAGVASPIPDDAEVRLRLGDEFPMHLDWQAADGDLNVHQMIAPRIQKR